MAKKAKSGEHPAIQQSQRVLEHVKRTVDEAIEESKRRLDAELESYIDSIDQSDARRAFPSSY